MKNWILGAAAAMIAPMMIGMGAAHADENSEDVRCLIIFMQMSNAQVPAAQTGGLIGSFYYMGKLDARSRDLDLEKMILTEVANMSENSFKQDAARCGSDMTKRGQAAADLGKALQQHAAQMEKLGEPPKPGAAKPDAAKPAEKPADKPADKPQ
jgi:hypothetical protein